MAHNLITKGTAEVGDLITGVGSAGAARIPKLHRVNITYSTANSGEVDTGSDISRDWAILGVYGQVKTASTGGTGTMDLGLISTSSGDADGFWNGVDVSATGWVRGGVTVTTSAGVYYSANTLGAYLSNFNAGTTTASAGLFNEKPHMGTDSLETNISWTPGSTDWGSFDLEVLFFYIERTT